MTTIAESATKGAERQVAQLTVVRASLAKRYKDELDQIDRLKNQRASWRRDRELRANLSDSLETANQLSAATRDLERAKLGLANARRSYLTAIDVELSAGPAPVRAQQLARAKAQLVPQVNDVPRRIVIPDFDVDPLADPEELDQRAAELRAAEQELGSQLLGLRAQAEDLDHQALLRKHHDRAGDLFNRDDDEPRHNTVRTPDSGPEEGGGGGGGRQPSSPVPGSTNFENFVPIVLVDVIDASTINSLAAAQRSGDPAQRAAAARRAHDAVARRFEEVRNRRLEIEAR
ncbi:MAG TPA: hypothetical protein VMR96_05335, partial [Solirubrobacterales bacterium]|nr:hypothetical protein [Solirubrobacterales bacterium]